MKTDHNWEKYKCGRWLVIIKTDHNWYRCKKCKSISYFIENKFFRLGTNQEVESCEKILNESIIKEIIE